MLRDITHLSDLDYKCLNMRKFTAFLSDLDKKRFVALKYRTIHSTFKRFR